MPRPPRRSVSAPAGVVPRTEMDKRLLRAFADARRYDHANNRKYDEGGEMRIGNRVLYASPRMGDTGPGPNGTAVGNPLLDIRLRFSELGL
jgi:hypothetical protein